MSSNKSWVLEVDPTVYKFLAKIPRRDGERIVYVMQNLPSDPFEGDIQKMKGREMCGEGEWSRIEFVMNY